MTTVLKFNVLDDELVIDGESFLANDNPHEIKSPKKALARALGSAHHAGAADVIEGLVDDHVQSQEDGEKAFVEAQGDWVAPAPQPDGTIAAGYWSGPWREGHEEQARIDAEAKAAQAVENDNNEEVDE